MNNLSSQLPNTFNSTIEILTIDPSGKALFAILHEPREPKGCILMLNSGMLNRSGPQRLYWRFANEAVKHQYAVVRLDLTGVGDTLKDVDESHFDNHDKEDVDQAIKFLLDKYGDIPIYLQGLCAGARVAFKTSQINKNIKGILAWSTEIFTASQNMPQSPLEPENRLSNYEVHDTLNRLKNFVFEMKFARISWWKKEYPNGKGFLEDVSKTLLAIVKKFKVTSKQVESEFLTSTDAYLAQNKPVYFLFGEHDERAKTEFVERFSFVKETDDSRQAFAIIAQGTHTFATFDSQKILIDKSISWLNGLPN